MECNILLVILDEQKKHKKITALSNNYLWQS